MEHTPGDVLKIGYWLYDGTIRCRVEIQFSDVRFGSGDHLDPPEWREDQPGEWFVVSYASPADPDVCPPAWRHAQGASSLEAAISEAERTLSDCGLEWDMY